MPKVSKKSATKGGDHGPVVDHADDLDGYTVKLRRVPPEHRSCAAAQGTSRRTLPVPALGLRPQGQADDAFRGLRRSLRSW
jgi:hypothetical protein